MGQPGTVAPLPDASNHVKVRVGDSASFKQAHALGAGLTSSLWLLSTPLQQNVAMGSVTMPVASPALGSPFIDTTNRMGSMSPLIRHGSATYSTMQVSGYIA
jgi:hypothetical protein